MVKTLKKATNYLDIIEEDMYLDFVDDRDSLPPGFVESRVDEALEQFGFEEILAENGIDEAEALGLLYENGYIGLPEFLDDDEVQDQEDEED